MLGHKKLFFVCAFILLTIPFAAATSKATGVIAQIESHFQQLPENR